jgi:hypothetical protein
MALIPALFVPHLQDAVSMDGRSLFETVCHFDDQSVTNIHTWGSKGRGGNPIDHDHLLNN